MASTRNSFGRLKDLFVHVMDILFRYSLLSLCGFYTAVTRFIIAQSIFKLACRSHTWFEEGTLSYVNMKKTRSKTIYCDDNKKSPIVQSLP